MKINNIQNKSKGTFAGVKFNEDTITSIRSFAEEHKIPNILPSHKIHTTLLYSRKYLPNYVPEGVLKSPMVGTFKAFKLFDTEYVGEYANTSCLVLQFNCAALLTRHNHLMAKYNATFDRPTYEPFVTLSYNAANFDISSLPKFESQLIIVDEYKTALQLTWTLCKDHS